MADLTGKRIIVTGGTNGIGEVAAHELAKMGASVTVISRSETKLQNTVAAIQAAGGDADYIRADLSSIEQIHAAAAEYQSRYTRLDVLLNNAGAVFTERKESVNGIEMTIALNHISYFLLTHDLLDLIKQTAAEPGEARIVNVSSEAHRSGMHWNDIEYKNSYSGFGAYGQSKAMNILFTKELARRLADTNVTVNAVHPGLVSTGFGDNNGGIMKLAAKVIKLFGKSPEDGAKTSIYVASSPDVKGVTGKYFADSQQKAPIPEMENEANWTRLWELSEQWVGLEQPASA